MFVIIMAFFFINHFIFKRVSSFSGKKNPSILIKRSKMKSHYEKSFDQHRKKKSPVYLLDQYGYVPNANKRVVTKSVIWPVENRFITADPQLYPTSTVWIVFSNEIVLSWLRANGVFLHEPKIASFFFGWSFLNM